MGVMEGQESRSRLARYAVGNNMGQFAWFLTEKDATEFIALQPLPETHWVAELTRW